MSETARPTPSSQNPATRAKLYRAAQHAIRLRDDFFSVASHELKTPVAALMAFSQFMRKRAERRGGLTTAQISEALHEVHWQSDRIARLVSSAC